MNYPINFGFKRIWLWSFTYDQQYAHNMITIPAFDLLMIKIYLINGIKIFYVA